MARIAGVDIPREKRVIVSLTYIHGIGPTATAKVIGAANVSPCDGPLRRLLYLHAV